MWMMRDEIAIEPLCTVYSVEEVCVCDVLESYLKCFFESALQPAAEKKPLPERLLRRVARTSSKPTSK